MEFIFRIKDKTGRKIYLSKERWNHITSPTSPHAYMINYLDEIEQTLINPDTIIDSINNAKVNYYKYYKKKRQYTKIIVNYLNGEGFVITSYFVKHMG